MEIGTQGSGATNQERMRHLEAINAEMLEICKSGHNRFTSASHTLRMIAASFGENSGFSNWLHYKANQMEIIIAKAEAK